MAKRLNPEAFNGWVYEHIDDYSHRLEVYYGGAGSGKSYGAFQKVILKALNLRRKVLVIRKVGAPCGTACTSSHWTSLPNAGFAVLQGQPVGFPDRAAERVPVPVQGPG